MWRKSQQVATFSIDNPLHGGIFVSRSSTHSWQIYVITALIALTAGGIGSRLTPPVASASAEGVLWAAPGYGIEMLARQQAADSTGQTTQALKLGFIRSDIIMNQHPSVPGIRTSLEGQLLAWQRQQEDMQARAEALQNELRTAQLSPGRRRAKEEELQTTADELAQFQTQMWSQGGIAEQKEQELMQPVFDEIDAVIRDIAEGQGFHLIFDASAGGLLFGHIEMDLTLQAMEKIGIEPPKE